MQDHLRDKTNDDPFGLLVLTLRKQAGLTQVELATLVGVTEKAVRNWEAGTAFPSENKLKKLIETYLGLGAFTPGQEREEARTLCKQACQTASCRKAIFDETWFTILLAQQRHPIFKPSAPVHRVDPRQGSPSLRERSAPLLKDSAADRLSPLSSAPFRLHQTDQAEASEGISPISPLTSPRQIDRLLAAKLMEPSKRPRLVPRARLIQRLQAELGRKLTLLVAPAGFGKSTLLLDWITSGGQRVAWLSLEADDNSLVRFWHYVVAALQTVRPELGTATLATLRECEPTQLEPAVAELLNELAALEQNLVLVLDDYQVITEPPIHAALAFLLEHLPPHVQLVLATRVEPPLPLARLRARGQLMEMRAEDLRFSTEEATRFLADTMELVLDVEQVAQLAARMEGWVAGLQLAALALRGHADVDQFLAGFSGSHRYLVDYLTKDVLLREPEPMQRFLLETSLLQRLCAPLCAAVTGSAEAEQLLEQAEQANLFLMPLDGHRQWYRYHALFAQFLQQQLHHTSPEQVQTLHRRAAQWFEEQELIAEAMHHALAGADYERAARLLTQHARTFLLLGETVTLRTWIQALPEAVMRAQPRLCLLLVDALATTSYHGVTDGWLRATEERLRTGEPAGAQAESGSRGLLEEVLALRAALATRQLDLPSAQERVHQAGEHLPPDDALGRTFIAYDLGIASFRSGDMVAASQAFAEVSLMGAGAGSLYYEMAGLQGVGWVLLVRGKLRQAAETFRQVLQRVAGQQGQPALLAGAAHTSLGMVLCEWNDLDGAEQALLEGLEQALLEGLEQVTGGGHFSMLVLASLQLARLRQARSDAGGAYEQLVRTQEAVRRSDEERFASVVAACQVQLWLQQGNLAAAKHWAATVRLEPEQPITWVGEMERLALVRVQLAQGQAQEALQALERLRLAAETAGRGGSVLEIRLLEALAQQRLGNTAQALAQLAEALVFSEPEGYVRLFVDEGPVMEALLALMLAAQRSHRLAVPHSSVAYLEHLLAAFGRSAAPRAPCSETAPRTTQPLIEPLTARELAVLRLLATGKSTREIAGELIVAPSTINWHLKHLYAKLQVHSRTQALSRARQFHLLD